MVCLLFFSLLFFVWGLVVLNSPPGLFINYVFSGFFEEFLYILVDFGRNLKREGQIFLFGKLLSLFNWNFSSKFTTYLLILEIFLGSDEAENAIRPTIIRCFIVPIL